MKENVHIFSSNTNWGNELRDFFRKYENISCKLLLSRADMIESISSTKFSCCILEDVCGTRDINVITRCIANSKMNSSATVLIATKEFELFNKIIESNPKLNIRVLNLPQTNDEILKAVLIELETLKSNTEVVDRPSVEMEILGSFVDGTKDTIIEMSMDESIKSKKPLLLSEIKEDLSIGIRGRIVIQSKFFKGSFFISFPTESYLELYKMVVFEEHDAINEENQDFATELANIIYGKAKSNLNSKGYELGMVIPDLVFDKKLESKESILVIPYSGAFGNFYIKIAPNLV